MPDRDQLLAEMVKRAGGRQGRKGGIHVHNVPQGDLAADRPWQVKHGSKNVGPRIVSHLQRLVDSPAAVEPLEARWSIPQGVQTGADAYTQRIQRRLRNSFPKALRQLEANGAELGEPILELPHGREREAPWGQNQELLARSVEPHAILYGALDEDDYTSLIWLGRADEAPRAVVQELEKWKPVLENRAEIRRNPSRRWWECAWTRDKEELRRPKVIALYRPDRGRFAIDTDGSWQPSIKTTLVIPRDEGLSVSYLGGLLNSELLDLWYAVRGKTPWHVRRNYEPKRMKEIPYRHLELSRGRTGADLKALKAELGKGGLEAAADHASVLTNKVRSAAEAGLTVDTPEAIEAARALELVVEAIADNRRALLSYRDRFPELSRVIKDPWSREVVDPAAREFVAALPKKRRASVRVDPDLEAVVHSDGILKAGVEGGKAVFRYRRQVVAEVDGPADKLVLLVEMVAGETRTTPKDLLALELPREVASFKAEVETASADVARLLGEGNVLVEAAERLVCALYGVPAELEDEVVAHAVARANPPAPQQ